MRENPFSKGFPSISRVKTAVRVTPLDSGVLFFPFTGFFEYISDKYAFHCGIGIPVIRIFHGKGKFKFFICFCIVGVAVEVITHIDVILPHLGIISDGMDMMSHKISLTAYVKVLFASISRCL